MAVTVTINGETRHFGGPVSVSVPMVQGGDLIGVALLSSAGGAKKVEDEEVDFLEFTCGLIGGYLTRWETKSADSRKPTT